MEIGTTKLTSIFNTVGKLIDKITLTNIDLLRHCVPDSSIENIINTTSLIVSSEISMHDSLYKFGKNMMDRASYVHPEERAISSRYEMKVDKISKISIPRLIQSTCQFVPITDQLKIMFENEKFRNLYFEYNSDNHICVEGQFKRFCCGTIYKNNQLFQSDSKALQIEIYTDDLEICSPLQSKSGIHKLCAVYFSVNNFPIEYKSKLNFIRLVSLCYSDDINKSTQADYNNIWQLVVNDIKKLETKGIDIGTTTLRGTICWIAFDNLGANVCLGYAKSFSAGYYCRMCECSANECGTVTREMTAKVRNREKYSNCMKTIDSLDKIDYKKTFGLRTYCCLNNLTYFHITENISVDLSHDIYEGSMPLIMEKIFLYVMREKILKKDELIQMIASHDYGRLNRRNKPSNISLGGSHLGQNGSQTYCLFLNLPFIFATFRGNSKLRKVWSNYELLSQISQIVHSREISSIDLNELNNKISALLTSFKTNFDEKVTPKLHNLTHYSRVIRNMGPVVNMNTIRYEAKHKVFKNIVNKTCNFINVCKTLAIRHQQNMSISDEGLKIESSCGGRKLLEFCEHIECLPDNHNNKPIFVLKFFSYNNQRFEKGFLIIYAGSLYEIENIIEIDTEIYFQCIRYMLLEYDVFFNSYKISSTTPILQKTLKFENSGIIYPLEKKKIGLDQYIRAQTLDVKALFK